MISVYYSNKQIVERKTIEGGIGGIMVNYNTEYPGNTISNNTISASKDGIRVFDSKYSIINGNTITGCWANGIELFTTSTLNHLFENRIEDCYIAFSISNAWNNMIYHNTISGCDYPVSYYQSRR